MFFDLFILIEKRCVTKIANTTIKHTDKKKQAERPMGHVANPGYCP